MVLNHKPTYQELEQKIKELESKISNSSMSKNTEKDSIQLLMDCIPGFAFVKDASLTYISANKTFCELLNIPANSIYGKTDYDIFPDHLAEKYIEDDKKVLNTGIPFYAEEKTIDLHHGGQEFTVATRKLPWYDNDGNICGIYGLGFDISELIETRDNLEKEEKKLKELNATKDKLFSIIGHDLKNPIGHILAFSERLSKNIETYDIEKTRKFLSFINTSAKKSFHLLESLLEWAKTQTNQVQFNPSKISTMEAIDLSLKELEPLANLKNINLKSFDEADVLVFADYSMLMTVLRNLISNAIKFTHPFGAVSVCIKQVKNEAYITISDTGVGMSENRKNELFYVDRISSTTGTNNEKGSGLGLAICFEFIKKNGGTIWVESTEGKGSDFIFTVPLYMVPAQKEAVLK